MMLFCARLRYLVDLLMKHRHIRPSRLVKLTTLLSLCLLLQRSIKREDDLYERVIKAVPIPEDPLFIVGHWRSGTTYLHYLLGLDHEHVAYPTNYQCFFPTVFLTINEQSRTYHLIERLMGRRTRLIDNMELTLTSPQEEEWMYLPEGGYSYLFEQLIFPKTAVSDHDTILKLSNDQKTREITWRIFKKLTFVYQKRIVSKSPGHFSRLSLLQEIFPKAQMIFLVRHPYDIVASTINMKTILTRILSLQKRSVVYDVTATAQFLNFYYDVVARHLSKFYHNQYIIIKYEDFVEEPSKNVQHIYQHFGIDYTTPYHDKLIAYLNALKDYKRSLFNITPEMRAIIYRECRNVFETYDYAP